MYGALQHVDAKYDVGAINMRTLMWNWSDNNLKSLQHNMMLNMCSILRVQWCNLPTT
jgi:hypothetical protein